MGCESCRADNLLVQPFNMLWCLLGTPQRTKQLATRKEMGTCLQRRYMTWVNSLYQQSRLPSLQRAHVPTTDHNSHGHEWRLLIVSPEPKKNTHQRLITSTNRGQTWFSEEKTTRRTVHQHDTCTQRASIFFCFACEFRTKLMSEAKIVKNCTPRFVPSTPLFGVLCGTWT